jgi:hypothetical protein
MKTALLLAICLCLGMIPTFTESAAAVSACAAAACSVHGAPAPLIGGLPAALVIGGVWLGRRCLRRKR